MKKFDFNQALQGYPVRLRHGSKAHIAEAMTLPGCLLGYFKIEDEVFRVVWDLNGRTMGASGDDELDIVGMWEEHSDEQF